MEKDMEGSTPSCININYLTEMKIKKCWGQNLKLFKYILHCFTSYNKHVFFSFFFFNIYLFICFWLCWVFVAAHGLPLVAVSGGYSSLRCTGFSLQWLLLLQSMGSRHVGFSSCGVWTLERRLSSCGAWA